MSFKKLVRMVSEHKLDKSDITTFFKNNTGKKDCNNS